MSESIHPIFEPANLSDQERSRLHNLEALVAAGIEPYPARVKRTHTVADARALFERGDAGEDAVTVTGRIKRMRIMGKMSFADLE
ncbi:MAG: lysine--tRNA ligase, partial [Caldilinea sp.]|nr:lysine--tRNA ligase [Caldilinea sp.]